MAKKNMELHGNDRKVGSKADENDDEDPSAMLNNKTKRAVQWLVQMLLPYLKKIVAMREANAQIEGGDDDWYKVTATNLQLDDSARAKTDEEGGGSMAFTDITVLDQVKEIIKLPKEDAGFKRNWQDIKLGSRVEHQLLNYISSIASMYRDNSFHGFEHASHVTMSAVKLLTRVVAEHSIDFSDMQYKQKDGADLHTYTHGISDPLTQFAIIFSALIHDVDHTGVPNATLVNENSYIAEIYKNKSVAEQNSVDLAWGLLMEPSYRELRNCLCATKDERERFRQLVVNAVMATDIADKELGAQRRQRWEKAFSDDKTTLSLKDISNRKATIVIEHLIQVRLTCRNNSRVCETTIDRADNSDALLFFFCSTFVVELSIECRLRMCPIQLIIRRQKLFEELYKAYKDGRSDTDPSIGWYKGELGFFDFYWIPLAKKLRDCGVFGVSSDEFLNYALLNRAEWEKKGEGIVDIFLTQAIKKHSDGDGEADGAGEGQTEISPPKSPLQETAPRRSILKMSNE